MVLRHSAGLEAEAAAVESAVAAVLAAGYRTPDIARGSAAQTVTTSQMGKLVHEALSSLSQSLDRRSAFHAV